MLFPRLSLAVFLSVLCDNLLLTVVVPILPEFLREKAAAASVNGKITSGSSPRSNPELNNLSVIGTRRPIREPHLLPIKATEATTTVEPGYLDRVKTITKSCFKELFHLQMLDEDSKLGLLLSTKAIVQLICNPLVGKLTIRFGYKLPLCIGNAILFLCALAFGFADSYLLLVIGRSCHGLASGLVTISGMALVAEQHAVDADRTVCMGRVMGAAALGVLIGYPFGGFLYAFLGKLVPFLLIATLAFMNCVLCISQLKLFQHEMTCNESALALRGSNSNRSQFPAISSCWSLLKDKSIIIISMAIWFSTMAMAVLEPTLPLWLIETTDPPKWQLGLVFVPDSAGYFIGTNFFGPIALRIGRWKASMISMVSIGVACMILPFCRAVWQLSFPHFTLGLGLGIVDASLMPLLACFTDDMRHEASYGTVYALAQTSVALAYSLGPLLGGQLVRLIGFPDLIRSVGFLNLIFAPFTILLAEQERKVPSHFPLKLKEEWRRRRPQDQVLSTSTSSSNSMEEIDTGKKVRFHFHINNEKFPLTALMGNAKGYSVQPKRYESYERFYNDFDSD